ncbi:MAG: tRNA (adenosine(37)-N6)-threonylcarbamoyltransferase complex dimerization subunit type 1 TsaB [Mycoplasmataceae bacterium]|nr:tRNA (adenosine(37)-N6)-threonylcarbamoyltransferase complex dimerization subunit type 1 TsaB [Mycoplasmataceae bacterium]
MYLFIDTSQTKCNLALFDEGKIIESFSVPTLNNLTDMVVEEIDSLLSKNDIDKQSISRIYLTTGPGSFTGVRVGCLVAKAWSIVRNIEIYAIDSLRLQVVGDGISLLDARGQNFYHAEYKGETVIVEPEMIPKDEADKLIASKAKKFIDYENVDIFDNLLKSLQLFKKISVSDLNPLYIKAPV